MPKATNDQLSKPLSSEPLAYWFFRLNGFLTTTNFVVHRDDGDQGTDADILAVRFPFRSELFDQPMIDHPAFTRVKDKPLLLIVECKRAGECRLNGPWTNREKKNIDRVLRALGPFAREEIERVADALYREATYEGTSYSLSLACVAAEQSKSLHGEFPEVLQFTWGKVLDFIHQRFTTYRRQKSCHPQWDDVGRDLWSAGMRIRDPGTFRQSVLDRLRRALEE